MKQNLMGVSETLLIPLWARAVETGKDCPIIQDEQAVSMVEQIQYDFSRFRKGVLSQVGVAVRTYILDQAVQDFIRRHPDGVVVNLGCGLDTRFWRLDNGSMYWYDIDFPEPIRIRHYFFSEHDRYHMIVGSVLEEEWLGQIAAGDRPVLFIAEGLLMYFSQEEVTGLLVKLARFFPGSAILMEIMPPFIARNSRHHDTVGDMQVTFQWSAIDAQAAASLLPGTQVLAEWNYFDYHRSRWGWFGWLGYIPFCHRTMNNKIAYLRLPVAE